MKAKLTIVHAVAKEQEDIFTVGNLVISHHNEIILVTCADSGHGKFAGVCVIASQYSSGWYKEAFKQYRGSVSLSTVE